MDQGLFEYLGMDAKEFLNIVKTARDDSGIEAYAKTFVAKKDPRDIEAFNKKWLSAVPTGESLKHFDELRTKIAPDRTDVVSWPDLLDPRRRPRGPPSRARSRVAKARPVAK